MIQSIFIIHKGKKINYSFDKSNSFKIVMDCLELIDNKFDSFDLEITFTSKIQHFRNHDYTWVDISQERIANQYCPKVLKLENNSFVQANINNGFWEVNPSRNNVLLWRFNPDNACSFTKYSGKKSIKTIQKANFEHDFPAIPTLLLVNKPIEFGRSKIDFSAIVCFTDHCDFDTPENLLIQLGLFNDLKIKVTKGFFMNHFSKRADNASYENQKLILDKWHQSGHELCYHSLSQSIKPLSESIVNFENFEPPFLDISVWIDHGFQPYNFSFYRKSKISDASFETTLSDKCINILWNYIDSGTATLGVINQLNTSQFTLNSFASGIKIFSLKTRLIMVFKNIIFHHDNNETRIRNYIDGLTAIKKIISKGNFLAIIDLFKNINPVILLYFRSILSWNYIKNQPYRLSKYQPILFKHTIAEKTFNIFQTLEMIDFRTSLDKKNINLLIKESGIFIAHTYFSANAKHYSGKLFVQENILDPEVVCNLEYLSDKIHENKIWNPTLSELVNYWSNFEKTIIDVDSNGEIVLVNKSNLICRIIN
ncbi:MAG: hypothetical protein H7174_02780 [Flavobacterium sp.]|nr:hypothetical protein [Flavobacterium sp.]